jgi:sulfur carrier protein ThiS
MNFNSDNNSSEPTSKATAIPKQKSQYQVKINKYEENIKELDDLVAGRTDLQPKQKKTINDILVILYRLKQNPTKENLDIIKAINIKYYTLLKDYYTEELFFYNIPIPENYQGNYSNQEEIRVRIHKMVTKYTELLAELEQIHSEGIVVKKNETPEAREARESHELNLQEQMRKQRAAHNKALKNSSTNESNLVNTFAQVGLNAPRIPDQLAANSSQGFNQRRANAEKQAAAAVAAWKKKGGKRTRRKKYKNKSRKIK